MARMDARLRELQFLARLDREGTIEISGAFDGSPERQMILSLILDGHVNDGFEELKVVYQCNWGSIPERQRWVAGHSVGAALAGQRVSLRISHKGRVRLSELEQQLQTGRDRDETGLLWAKRHLVTDLAIAILGANSEAPLSVVFLDMNGLKSINDTHGHAAGDEVIRAFFQATVATLGQHGEAYRNGGDEVVIVLPGVDDANARKLLDSFVRQLGKDTLVLGTEKVRLTASCGSVSTTDPVGGAEALIKHADKAMYRAKAESKKHDPRVSAYAVGDGDVVLARPADG